jgi:DNA-binding NtrC family response regulator
LPRILLVEDDADVRVVFEHALLDAGYRVDVVTDAAGARQLLAEQDYDLLVTDGRLPDGTGMTLADQAQRRRIAALLVTGYAFNLRDDDPGVDLSKYNLLLKPIRPHELIAEVERALAARDDES